MTLIACGCAEIRTTPNTPLPPRDFLVTFLLEGRFSLRQEDENHSGKLRWRHIENQDDLLLSSPFGQGIAEINATTNRATLTTSDGKQYSAEDVSTLTEQVLGYRLPLPLLVDWVRGKVTGDDVLERDGYGRPIRFRYDDWHIRYEYDAGESVLLHTPPIRLFVERMGVFELRLRIDEWTPLSGQGSPQ